MSPSNFATELAAVRAAWAAGARSAPSFLYGAAPYLGDVPERAMELAAEIEPDGVLGALYAARARELALEAAIIDARETERLPALAASRFSAGDPLDAEADRLARDFATAPVAEAPASDAEMVTTDDTGDPRSLVCRARDEIGKLRLPVRVVAHASLAPLAAAGDRVLQIARKRRVRVVDVERTVMHEVHGHLLPMARAAARGEAIFEVGSARGSEGQEGYALLLEERAGFLVGARARELGLRHLAARAAHRGVGFANVVDSLCALGAPLDRALRIAARAARGGGLGREAGYLVAYLDVKRGVLADPSLEAVIASGRLSVDAARALAALAPATS